MLIRNKDNSICSYNKSWIYRLNKDSQRNEWNNYVTVHCFIKLITIVLFIKRKITISCGVFIWIEHKGFKLFTVITF